METATVVFTTNTGDTWCHECDGRHHAAFISRSGWCRIAPVWCDAHGVYEPLDGLCPIGD